MAVFSPFDTSVGLPDTLTAPMGEVHPLCLLAAKDLQRHLQEQEEWEHNFGLAGGAGRVIGKMFGVLVVKTAAGELGYLAAFSGKLANGNYHDRFVPPIFDGMAEDGFLTEGMLALGRMKDEIDALEAAGQPAGTLKTARKNHSIALQQRIFEQYHFLNQAGESKGLIQLFEAAGYKSPPAGAGECAAPKLLQYAYGQRMQPIALAEFWWGLSPKSATWKHGHFYAPCKEKCAPILAHMLPQ